MNSILIVPLLFLFSFTLNAETPSSVINNYEKQLYFPQDDGLIDLEIVVKIPNLIDQLKSNAIYKNIKNIYFKLFWLKANPPKVGVEVIGLSKELVGLESQLKAMVLNRLDYVVPHKPSQYLKDYKLVLKKNKKGSKTITASNGSKIIYELILRFDSNNMLKKLIARKPTGTEITSFNYKKPPWNKSKKVLDKIEVKVVTGMQSTSVTNYLDYGSFKGIGLPKKLQANTLQTLQQPAKKKNSTYKREVKELTLYQGHMVNQGNAKKYFDNLKSK